MTLLRQSLISIILLLAVVITGCGGGPAPAFITATGTVTFDSVPTSVSSGLVYANTIQKPARGIVIEAINIADSSVLASTSTDNLGKYSVTLPSNTNVKIRAKAQLKSSAFDFQVVDNTNVDISGKKALYVMESAPFSSGSIAVTKNLNAASGWGTTSYTGTRAAAPFAILDTAYKCMSKVTAADPAATFPPLQINWSVNNVAASGSGGIPAGQIGTSYYDSYENALYILGKADSDTDEYDDHVIAHEWGHYFEDNFSRADSIGGPHGNGDKLDPRVAFGEGWGNAFSGMATDDRYYVDTSGSRQASRFYLDLSDANGDTSSIGWFSEDSIQYILYSLYMTPGIGFSPIYSVLVNDQKTANSYTTIYSFSAFMKSRYPAHATTLNTLLASKTITSQADQWDSSQTEINDGGTAASLPVYVRLNPGTQADLSVSDVNGTDNKLLSERFFVFTVSAGSHSIRIDRPSTSSPCLAVMSSGKVVYRRTCQSSGVSSVTVSLGNLSAGTYYGTIYENTYATGTIPFKLTLN